jgi:hypothetical protein
VTKWIKLTNSAEFVCSNSVLITSKRGEDQYDATLLLNSCKISQVVWISFNGNYFSVLLLKIIEVHPWGNKCWNKKLKIFLFGSVFHARIEPIRNKPFGVSWYLFLEGTLSDNRLHCFVFQITNWMIHLVLKPNVDLFVILVESKLNSI